MKTRLVELLACPRCTGDLTLEPSRSEGGEVIEGRLLCRSCPAGFPVIRGIPRFVLAGGYAESFGFEWTRFGQVQLDAVTGQSESERGFRAKTGFTPDDLEGRVILDAGVGAGRYADVVSRWGGEVIGVDSTEAVDAAFANIGMRPGVHLVQADIFALPLRAETVDVAYSIGVLHHTPAPAQAFRCVSRVVRKGGMLAVYLYPALGLARHFSDALRVVTTRLPRRLMFGLSAIAVPLYYVYRLPLVGKVCQTICPISLHPDWRWRWLDTFDWYTPKYQFKFTYPAVYRLFRDNGCASIELFEEPICARGVKDA